MKKGFLLYLCIFVLIFSSLLSACQSTATNEEATEVVEATTEEQQVTAEESVESKIGGTYHFAQYGDPDTLDAHLTSLLVSTNVLQFIGAALIALDPDGNVVPWLAKSWDVSDDGLVWTFHLRDDVKFTDGEPLTANDFVFTYKRAIDPTTVSAVTGANLGPTTVDSFVAVDDYTFQITLSEPYYSLVYNLADPSYMMPFSQKAFEEMGAEEWASNPVSCGPYVVSSWQRGSEVVLTRNTDYNWGPSIDGMNKGPWNFDTIEILVIPEYSTILAGLETGEIDYAQMETKDVETLTNTGYIEALEAMQQGPRPFFLFNVSKAPFDDLKVRQAFNLAINRDALIQVMVQGKGYVQYGPLTPSQIGYWDGVENIGYGYDLERAKALMQEAGYTYGNDGMLITPDGEPFKLTVNTLQTESWVKTTEVVAEQLKELGVSLNIMQSEAGILIQSIFSGDYEFSIMGNTALEGGDMLYLMFHSSMIGGNNMSFVSDPDLDVILQKIRTETDAVARQEWVNQAQQIVIEKAYIIPLYIPINYYAINMRVKGYTYSTNLNTIYLQDAYIEE